MNSGLSLMSSDGCGLPLMVSGGRGRLLLSINGCRSLVMTRAGRWPSLVGRDEC